MLEGAIEKKFVALCKKYGIKQIKIQTQGPRGKSGYPDRQVLLGQGRHCWIEFKATGKVGDVTDLQDKVIGELRAMGEAVFITDDAGAALDFVYSVMHP